MQLAVVGVSHRTAPVEVRERLAFSAEGLQRALTSLVDRNRISEAMILSTCNRIEIVVQESGGANSRSLEDFLCGFHQVPAESVSEHLYTFRNADAIRHIFRVTSSLDSMMVGEPQILGQVKEAFRIANDAGAIGMNLSALMNRAFAVAKKVRSETGISQSAVSISYAAVELARKIFGQLTGKTVMIIGASKMGELAAKHLKRNGVGSVLVTNRTFDRAVELAKVFEGGVALPFEHFVDHIDHADIVITSTGAPHFIVTRPMAEQIIHRRKNRPVFFIDIAVPRDVDPQVGGIPDVFLYDIDDLQQVIDENMKDRQREAGRAEEIIASEVRAFCDRMQTREVAPMIVDLRNSLERMRRETIERNRKQLRDLPPEQAVDQITQAFVNRILHHPITELKAMAGEPNGDEFVEFVRRLFNIKSDNR
jgi:glutamyl-tRNA reductase